jgi:tetratricopeptide (TPR) repeat protein
VSDALYERYKDALRRGHVAALRGRLDAALLAYGEAAGIAPERALPHASLGAVLRRLGRDDEALAAFGRAIERNPADEAALSGRAEILGARGQRVEAADLLDRLAGTLDAAGRTAEACDAARRALEMAESRERRRLVRALVARLRSSPADGPAIAALEGALRVLGPDAAPDEAPEAEPAAATPASEAERGGPPDAPSDGPSTSGRDGEDPRTAAVVAAPGVLLGLDAERQVDAGDGPGAAAAWLRAAAAHRAEGHLDAALDACYLALALTPDDPGLHLALAEIYLERGWRAHAADKLLLLSRLSDLESDTATRERLCELASAHLPDETRLAEVCS